MTSHPHLFVHLAYLAVLIFLFTGVDILQGSFSSVPFRTQFVSRATATAPIVAAFQAASPFLRKHFAGVTCREPSSWTRGKGVFVLHAPCAADSEAVTAGILNDNTRGSSEILDIPCQLLQKTQPPSGLRRAFTLSWASLHTCDPRHRKRHEVTPEIFEKNHSADTGATPTTACSNFQNTNGLTDETKRRSQEREIGQGSWEGDTDDVEGVQTFRQKTRQLPVKQPGDQANILGLQLGQADEQEEEGNLSHIFSNRMAWRCTGRTNTELVEKLWNSGVIRSRRVYDVMLAVDRGKFVDVCAYADSPQPLGIGSATISAPHMHATALEELQSYLKPGNRVLDVGSGSGYLVVCMALLVGVRGATNWKEEDELPEGAAVGIDHIAGLVQYSRERVQKTFPDLLANPRFVLEQADGWKGYPSLGPYHAIHVGAGAASIPKKLVEQLAPGGKMVLPVEEGASGRILFEGEEEEAEEELSRTPSRGSNVWRTFLHSGSQQYVAVTKDNHGNVKVKKLMSVMYVPLVQNAMNDGKSTSAL